MADIGAPRVIRVLLHPGGRLVVEAFVRHRGSPASFDVSIESHMEAVLSVLQDEHPGAAENHQPALFSQAADAGLGVAGRRESEDWLQRARSHGGARAAAGGRVLFPMLPVTMRPRRRGRRSASWRYPPPARQSVRSEPLPPGLLDLRCARVVAPG